MKHLASATLALALALACVQVALALTDTPAPHRSAVTAHRKTVAYHSTPRATPNAAPSSPGGTARPAAAGAKAPHPVTFPDNDGSRFTYDSCGCLGT